MVRSSACHILAGTGCHVTQEHKYIALSPQKARPDNPMVRDKQRTASHARGTTAATGRCRDDVSGTPPRHGARTGTHGIATWLKGTSWDIRQCRRHIGNWARRRRPWLFEMTMGVGVSFVRMPVPSSLVRVGSGTVRASSHLLVPQLAQPLLVRDELLVPLPIDRVWDEVEV